MRTIPERPRRLQRPGAPVAHPRRSSCRRRRRPPARASARPPPASPRSGSSSSAAGSRWCASAWRPSSCSTPAQPRDEPHPVRGSPGAVELERLEQRGAAVLEPARGGTRRGQRRGAARRALPARRRRAGGAAQPRTSAPRSTARARATSTRLAQNRDRRRVAVARGLLDVVRARGGGRSARGERLRAALVRGKPHAGGARLVDRAAARAGGGTGICAAPRRGGRGRGRSARRAPQSASGSGIAAAATARSSSNGSPATAAASSESAHRRGQPVQLGRDGGRHGGRDSSASAGVGGRRPVAAPTGFARAGAGRRGCRRSRGRDVSRSAALGASTSFRASPGPGARAASCSTSPVRAPQPRSPREQGRSACPVRKATTTITAAWAGRREQMPDQLERRAVAPVDVVERQQQRLPGREPLDQLAHRVVRAEALGRRARLGRSRPERAQRGNTDASSPRPSAARRSYVARVERLEVGVEGVDHQAEGQLALELATPCPRGRGSSRALGAAAQARRAREVLPMPGSPLSATNL